MRPGSRWSLTLPLTLAGLSRLAHVAGRVSMMPTYNLV